MTKEKLFKDYKLAFSTISSNGIMYCVNDNYLKKEFESFYATLTKTIKISNLTNVSFIKNEMVEDIHSISQRRRLVLHVEEGYNFESTVHFFVVKVKKHLKCAINQNEFIYFPESL